LRSSLLVPAVVLATLLSTPGVNRAQEAPPPPRELPEPERNEEYEERLRRLNREEAQRQGAAECPGCSRRGEGIQVQPIPGTRLVAVLHDIDLEEEFLMVRLRFYNDGSDPATLTIDPAETYESFFVEFDGKRNFILRDDDERLDAKKPLAFKLQTGKMASWWARFPPLPPGIESFDVVIPPAAPFLNVPVAAD